MAESNFVDYVKIYCRSGKGGRGSAHMRREKYVPNGGPEMVKTKLLKYLVVQWFIMLKQVNISVISPNTDKK